MEIISAVERMVLPVDPNFEKNQTTDTDKLPIHDMLVLNPFFPTSFPGPFPWLGGGAGKGPGIGQ